MSGVRSPCPPPLPARSAQTEGVLGSCSMTARPLGEVSTRRKNSRTARDRCLPLATARFYDWSTRVPDSGIEESRVKGRLNKLSSGGTEKLPPPTLPRIDASDNCVRSYLPQIRFDAPGVCAGDYQPDLRAAAHHSLCLRCDLRARELSQLICDARSRSPPPAAPPSPVAMLLQDETRPPARRISIHMPCAVIGSPLSSFE